MYTKIIIKVATNNINAVFKLASTVLDNIDFSIAGVSTVINSEFIILKLRFLLLLIKPAVAVVFIEFKIADEFEFDNFGNLIFFYVRNFFLL